MVFDKKMKCKMTPILANMLIIIADFQLVPGWGTLVGPLLIISNSNQNFNGID